VFVHFGDALLEFNNQHRRFASKSAIAQLASMAASNESRHGVHGAYSISERQENPAKNTSAEIGGFWRTCYDFSAPLL
jgi:hypothetical protein